MHVVLRISVHRAKHKAFVVYNHEWDNMRRRLCLWLGLHIYSFKFRSARVNMLSKITHLMVTSWNASARLFNTFVDILALSLMNNGRIGYVKQLPTRPRETANTLVVQKQGQQSFQDMVHAWHPRHNVPGGLQHTMHKPWHKRRSSVHVCLGTDVPLVRGHR